MERAVAPAVRLDPAMLTHVLFELRKEAEGVLKRERAAIAADDAGVWRVLWVRLWVRLKAWAGRPATLVGNQL
jgi:hypothetical protein